MDDWSGEGSAPIAEFFESEISERDRGRLGLFRPVYICVCDNRRDFRLRVHGGDFGFVRDVAYGSLRVYLLRNLI